MRMLGKHEHSSIAANKVPDSMFTLFRVMSGAQSDSESAALDRALDLHQGGC